MTTELHDADARMLHPWSALNTPSPVFTWSAEDRAGGVFVEAEDGRLLDGTAGLWCVNVGYGRSEIGAAMQAQAARLPYASTFGKLTHAPAAKLAARLADHAPGDLTRVIFSTGGSTANETALRFANFYWTRRGQPKKRIIISREDSYHGSTFLTASISARFTDARVMETHDAVHLLPSLNPLRHPPSASFSADRVAEFAAAIALIGAENISCFIAEPVQASGGVIVPPPDYLQSMAALCRRHDILFIADEVVTGFGRLGPYFSIEQRFDVTPDMICVAKGLTSGYAPLGATLISSRLCQEADADGAAYFGHGFTYSGHPVAAAAALANLDILDREALGENARQRGAELQSGLQALASARIVRAVRGMDLLGAVEFSDHVGLAEAPLGQLVSEACRRRGVIIRAVGPACVMSPPLSIQRQEIDFMLNVLGDAIDEVSAYVG